MTSLKPIFYVMYYCNNQIRICMPVLLNGDFCDFIVYGIFIPTIFPRYRLWMSPRRVVSSIINAFRLVLIRPHSMKSLHCFNYCRVSLVAEACGEGKWYSQCRDDLIYYVSEILHCDNTLRASKGQSVTPTHRSFDSEPDLVKRRYEGK